MDSTDGEIVGAAPPPPGVTPNFVNPETTATRLIVVLVVFLVASTIICGLRLYTSRLIVGRWHLDDGFIAASSILTIAYTACNLYQTQYGLGRHKWEVPISDYLKYLKVGVIATPPLYIMSIYCTKISILIFYLRFTVSKAFRWTVYFLITIMTAKSVSASLGLLYTCKPIESTWNPTIKGKTCIDMNATFLFTAIFNVVTDITILLLPIWLLAPLRMKWKNKVGVTLILMTGGFIVGISISRLAKIPRGFGSTDTTRTYVDNFIWIAVEINVAIICACMPCLKALFKHHFPNSRLFDFRQSTQLQLRTFSLMQPTSKETASDGSHSDGSQCAGGRAKADEADAPPLPPPAAVLKKEALEPESLP